MRRRQPPDRFTRAEEGADDVRRKDPLEPRRVHRLDAHLRLEDAGIVHEPGEWSKPVAGLEQAHHVCFNRDVGADRDRASSSGLDGRDGRVRRRAVAAVIDGYRVPALCGQARRRGADAAAAAGNQEYSVHGYVL